MKNILIELQITIAFELEHCQHLSSNIDIKNIAAIFEMDNVYYPYRFYVLLFAQIRTATHSALPARKKNAERAILGTYLLGIQHIKSHNRFGNK